MLISNLKKPMFNRKHLFSLLYTILIFIYIFPPMFVFAWDPETGLDNSWRIALSLAKLQQFTWGKDIIFTYGPLGIWFHKFTIFSSEWDIVASDLFIYTTICLVIFHSTLHFTKIYHFIFHFLLWVFIHEMAGEWEHFWFFFTCIYWGAVSLSQTNHRRTVILYTLFLAVINFFIKANYGIIGILFAFVLIGYLTMTKRLKIAEFISYIVFMTLFTVALAYLLKTDLIDYTLSNLYIISGYNESMAVLPLFKWKMVLSIYVIGGLMLLCTTVYGIVVLRDYKHMSYTQLDNLFLLGTSILLAFVLTKYSIVRADNGHISSFVKLISLPLFLVIHFVSQNKIRFIYLSLILLNFGAYLLFYQHTFARISFYYPLSFVGRLHVLKNYFKEAYNGHHFTTKPNLPSEIREMIGKQTVDVVPSEISLVYFNHLHYNPRPVIQSYQAYNEYLDLKNRAKYLSNNRPDWIIYQVGTIDNKYAWGEETQTLLAMIQGYHLEKEWGNYLFLKKNTKIKKISLVKRVRQQSHTNCIIPIDTTQDKQLLHLIKINPQLNLYGKFLKIIFQEPELSLTMYAQNSTYSNRAIPIHLSKGMVVNTRVDTNQDAKGYFTNDGIRGKMIDHLQINQPKVYSNIEGFKNTIEIIHEWYKLE